MSYHCSDFFVVYVFALLVHNKIFHSYGIPILLVVQMIYL